MISSIEPCSNYTSEFISRVFVSHDQSSVWGPLLQFTVQNIGNFIIPSELLVTFITGAASVLIARAFNSVLRKKVGNTFSFSIGYFWLGGKYEYGERRENSSFLVGCTHCVQIGSDVPFPEEQIRKRDPDAPVMCPERESKAAHSIYIAWKDWRVDVIGNQSLIRVMYWI